MKRSLWFLLGIITLSAGFVGYAFRGSVLNAQSYTPPTLLPETAVPPASSDINRNTFGEQGCVWRDDIQADGTVTLHTSEQQAPDAFYLEGTAPEDPCDFYSSPDWKNLDGEEGVGEAALWPLGCFNPLNFYSFTTWIGSYGSFQFNKNYDSWDGFYDALTGATNKRKASPTVEIRFGNTAPKKGQKLSFAATPSGYIAPTDKLLFGWSRQKTDKNFISQQGLVAGGKEITNVSDFANSEGEALNSPACQRVTRVPANEGDRDSNGDGMGDAWEMQYFSTLSVSATADPDADGIILTEPEVLDTSNLPRLVPRGDGSTFRVPADDPDAYLGIRVTPDTTAQDAPGNEKFTNEEEYIWGTNPLDPDSDDDGFPDGADTIGLGQSSFEAASTLDVKSQNNNREKYQVAVVGTTEFLDETNSGHKKIMIGSTTQTLIAGTGDNLEAALITEGAAPTAGAVSGISQIDDQHRVVVEANTLGSDADRTAHEYSWFVEFRDAEATTVSARIAVPPTPEYSLADITSATGRIGKYVFKHPLTELLQYVPSGYTFSPGPGSLIYVTVDIANTVRKETTTKRIPIYLGTDSALEIDITDLDTGKTQTVEEYARTYCQALREQTPAIPLFCAQARFGINDVMPWLVFQGSKVVIKAGPTQTDTSKLTYKWFVNDVQVVEEYGAESLDNLLTLYPDGSQRVYNVRVEGHTKDRTRSRVFTAQVEMQVLGPQAAIVYAPVSAQVGSVTQLTGELLNFPESFVGSYSWIITNPDASQTSGSGKNFSFTPATEGSYNVDLAIQFQSSQNSQITFHKTVSILVGTPASLTARVGLYIASARSAFSENAQTLYRFSLLAFGVIVVVLTTFALIRKNKKK